MKLNCAPQKYQRNSVWPKTTPVTLNIDHSRIYERTKANNTQLLESSFMYCTYYQWHNRQPHGMADPSPLSIKAGTESLLHVTPQRICLSVIINMPIVLILAEIHTFPSVACVSIVFQPKKVQSVWIVWLRKCAYSALTIDCYLFYIYILVAFYTFFCCFCEIWVH